MTPKERRQQQRRQQIAASTSTGQTYVYDNPADPQNPRHSADMSTLTPEQLQERFNAAVTLGLVGPKGRPKTATGNLSTMTPDEIMARLAAANTLGIIRPQGPGVPGSDTTETKPTDPFWTSDDIDKFNSAYGDYQDKLSGLKRDIATTRAQTGYDLAENENQRLYNIRNASDELASRGLFQSSIRDGELADINGSAARRALLLTTNLGTAETYATDMTTQASNAWDNFQMNYNRRGVENAESLDATETPPTTSAPTGRPKKPEKPEKGQWRWSASEHKWVHPNG